MMNFMSGFNYSIEDSMRLINELKNKAEDKNKQIQEHPQVSVDKLSALKKWNH